MGLIFRFINNFITACLFIALTLCETYVCYVWIYLLTKEGKRQYDGYYCNSIYTGDGLKLGSKRVGASIY